MEALVKFFKLLIKRSFISYKWDEYARLSWSQEGEDLILDELLNKKQRGFYVDVGAHHPSRFSNTKIFYERGWKGINIDPLPGIKELFDRTRVRDENYELGIAEKKGILKYHMFNEPALNGFDDRLTEFRNGKKGYQVVATKEIQVDVLESILDKAPIKNGIDFLTIDVEGLDLQVLKSNNWQRFRPKFILTEILSKDMMKLNQDPVVCYLREIDYEMICCTPRTAFFQDKKPSKKSDS